MREKEEYPIPEWCKEDCIYRDPKAKFMPACQYPFKLIVKNGECKRYTTTSQVARQRSGLSK